MKKAFINWPGKSITKILIVILLSVCNIQQVFGMNYSIGATELFSNNIVKRADKKSGHEETLTLGLAGIFTSSRLSSGANTELRFIRRDKDLFENNDDVQVVGDIFANMDIIPQRFTWNNSVSSGLFLINQRASSNADNLLNAISFITEPELTFAITSIDTILLSSSYNYIFNDELFDSETTSGTFAWSHMIPGGAVSLNYTYLSVEYDNQTPGYITGNVFISYSRHWDQINASISVGEISLKRKESDEKSSTSSANANLDWQIFGTTHLGVSYNRGFYDSLRSLDYLASLELDNITDDTQFLDSTFTSEDVLTGVSLTETYMINFNQILGVNNFEMRLMRIKRDIDDKVIIQPLNRDDRLAVIINRPINPLTDISFTSEYFEREFSDDITRGLFNYLNFTRQPRQNLFFILGFRQEEQSSDFPEAIYDSLSVLLAVRYLGVI